MEHIKKLLPDPQNLTTLESCDSSGAESNLPTPILDRVFAVLTAIYGQKWTSLIIDEQMLVDMQKVWAYHLRDITVAEIKVALDKVPKDYPTWPPTVGEFMELCNFGKDHLPEFKSLPRPYSAPEIAMPAFEQLRSVLKYKT